MSRDKSVLIPETLFTDLIKHHLLDIEGLENRIRSGLEAKLERMTEHHLYTESKTAPDPEKREEARKKYLDKKGIWEDFR